MTTATAMPCYIYQYRILLLSSKNYIDEGLVVVKSIYVQRKTRKNDILKKIINYLRNVRPRPDLLSEEEKRYYDKRLELTVENDCILRGIRIVILDSLREMVLDEPHEFNMGMVKMKAMVYMVILVVARHRRRFSRGWQEAMLGSSLPSS